MSYPAGGYGSEGEQAAPPPGMVRVEFTPLRPTVTYTILGVTLFVYLIQELNRMGMLREPLLALSGLVFGAENLPIIAERWASDLLVLLGGKFNEFIMAGQIWRLLTPALLHANLIHVGMNMYSLFVLGRNLESFYGHWRFLALYILGALGGNVLSFLLSDGVSVGASTAIFGLIGAEGVFAYQNRGVLGPQARAMLNNTIFLILLNLFIGFSSQVIDNWGHLGGLALGALFAWFAGPRLAIMQKYMGYTLDDQRSPAAVVTAAAALFLLLAGIVFYVILAA